MKEKLTCIMMWINTFSQATNTNQFGVKKNAPLRAGCDTRSIFKQSTTGLNLEFALPQLKNPVCLK